MPEALGGRLRPLLPSLLPLRAELGGEGPAEGATFLLPLLLQVSDPGYGAGGEQQERERQAWLDTLGEPAVLRQLAHYAVQSAAACAPTLATAAADVADDAALYACQLLLNVVAGEAQLGAAPERHAASGAAAAERERRQQLMAAPEAQPLLHGLLHLAALRPAAAQQGGSPDQAVHAVRCGFVDEPGLRRVGG